MPNSDPIERQDRTKMSGEFCEVIAQYFFSARKFLFSIAIKCEDRINLMTLMKPNYGDIGKTPFSDFQGRLFALMGGINISMGFDSYRQISNLNLIGGTYISDPIWVR